MKHEEIHKLLEDCENVTIDNGMLSWKDENFNFIVDIKGGSFNLYWACPHLLGTSIHNQPDMYYISYAVKDESGGTFIHGHLSEDLVSSEEIKEMIIWVQRISLKLKSQRMLWAKMAIQEMNDKSLKEVMIYIDEKIMESS